MSASPLKAILGILGSCFVDINEEQDLNVCVSGRTEYIFKGSHFGITCQKPVVVQIFEESKSLHFQSPLVSNRFFSLVMGQMKVI